MAIAFPHNCNDRTQYFKVEVCGHIIADSSINGDVVCHQSIQSSTINGDVKSDGNIKVNELNAQKIPCNNITDCSQLVAVYHQTEGLDIIKLQARCTLTRDDIQPQRG